MTAGARTPEELDLLLEDAVVAEDGSATGVLFADGAVLTYAGEPEARGADAIRRALDDLRRSGCTYVARPGRVVMVRDMAVLVSGTATHVLRRNRDGTWRAVISLLAVEPATGQEDLP
jgi:ketosteroid isomerase-like protein